MRYTWSDKIKRFQKIHLESVTELICDVDDCCQGSLLLNMKQQGTGGFLMEATALISRCYN
jgi:hypothetical protein